MRHAARATIGARFSRGGGTDEEEDAAAARDKRSSRGEDDKDWAGLRAIGVCYHRAWRGPQLFGDQWALPDCGIPRKNLRSSRKGRHPTRSSVRGGFARGPLLLTLYINRVPLLRRMRVAPSQQRQQSRVQ